MSSFIKIIEHKNDGRVARVVYAGFATRTEAETYAAMCEYDLYGYSPKFTVEELGGAVLLVQECYTSCD